MDINGGYHHVFMKLSNSSLQVIATVGDTAATPRRPLGHSLRLPQLTVALLQGTAMGVGNPKSPGQG